MKYLKTYEEIQSEPQVGDYVLCEDSSQIPELNEFFKNTIGRIISKTINQAYELQYTDIIENIERFFIYNGDTKTYIRIMYLDEIIHFSPNKEDIEQILINNKYNL